MRIFDLPACSLSDDEFAKKEAELKERLEFFLKEFGLDYVLSELLDIAGVSVEGVHSPEFFEF